MPPLNTHSWYIAEVRRLHGNRLEVLEEYQGRKVKIKHRCKEHGDWLVVPCTVLTKKLAKGKCVCGRDSQPGVLKTHEQYVQEVNDLHNGTIEVVSSYINNATRLLHRCKVHNIVYESKPLQCTCRKCHMEKSAFKYKTLKVGRKSVKVQGYEGEALLWLLSTKNLTLKDVRLSNGSGVPVIEYRYKGRHKHYPDFFIPNTNTVVEVKSPYTLLCNKDTFYKTAAKARSARLKGYKYNLLIFNQDVRIPTPRSWFDMSYTKVKSRINAQLV